LLTIPLQVFYRAFRVLSVESHHLIPPFRISKQRK